MNIIYQRKAFVPLLWCILSALPLFGQAYGSISGTVLDPSGAAIAGAAVSVTEQATGHVSASQTDSSGRYVFSSLPTGVYDLKISASGFRSFEETDARLASGQSLQVDAKLLIGPTTSTVQVSATASTPYTVLNDGSGTRTATPLIDVPQSVEVLGHALIQDQDRRTLADTLINVSGVMPTKPEEILFTQPLVRGFPSEIYTDGLSMFGNTTTANDPTSLVGAQRVEVVKGSGLHDVWWWPGFSSGRPDQCGLGASGANVSWLPRLSRRVLWNRGPLRRFEHSVQYENRRASLWRVPEE